MSIPDTSKDLWPTLDAGLPHAPGGSERPADGCAAAVFETMPLVMRSIKREVQATNEAELSMQQFRALKFVQRNQGAHLSLLMEHVGGTLSAASKLVEALVERGLLEREASEGDRRRINLRLTPEGSQAIYKVHATAVATLERLLQPLSATERSLITLAMNTLRSTLERHISDKAEAPPLFRTEEPIA